MRGVRGVVGQPRAHLDMLGNSYQVAANLGGGASLDRKGSSGNIGMSLAGTSCDLSNMSRPTTHAPRVVDHSARAGPGSGIRAERSEAEARWARNVLSRVNTVSSTPRDRKRQLRSAASH